MSDKLTPAERREAVLRVCEHLLAGDCSVRQACEKEGVARTSVTRWANEDPALADHYARAKEERMMLDAEDLEEVASRPCSDPLELAQLKLIVDTKKWIYARRLPKVYGDRQHIEHSGSVDLGGVIEEARRRADG